MFTLHRPPTVIPAFVAILTFALSAPIAVQARDPMLAEKPVLAAEDQVPALAPAEASWDETSGYRSVEASRATIGHPTASTNDALPAALERGTRAESAVLWSILQQQDAVVATSDDRIANALFGDESCGDGSVEAPRTQRRTQR